MKVRRVSELWGLMYELGNRVGESWRLRYELEKQAEKPESESVPTRLPTSRVPTVRADNPPSTVKRSPF